MRSIASSTTATGPVTTLEEERQRYLQEHSPEVDVKVVALEAPVNWRWYCFVIASIVATVTLSIISSLMGFGQITPPEQAKAPVASPTQGAQGSHPRKPGASPDSEPIFYVVPTAPYERASDSPLSDVSPTPSASPTDPSQQSAAPSASATKEAPTATPHPVQSPPAATPSSDATSPAPQTSPASNSTAPSVSPDSPGQETPIAQ